MNQGKSGPPKERPIVRSEVPEGDFELARPHPAPALTGGDKGDYEPDRPVPSGNTSAAPPTPSADDAPASGAPVPASAPAPAEESAAAARTSAPVVDGAVPEEADGRGPAVPGEAHRPDDETQRPSGAAQPLHSPDPYSTPPYAEPGPWAPAPPVQHPAASPQGTAVTDTGAPFVPAPAPAPSESAPPAGPWGRYDPWAAAPLQQSESMAVARQHRRGNARRAVIGGALLLALASGAIGGIVGTYLERNGGVGTVELPQADKEVTEPDPGSVAGIAAQALPSVVTLHVSGAKSAGTGTGFVLDERGHILTNDHVVQPAGDDGEITVTFHSGDTAEATVVGRDSGYDLAVVRVKGVRGLSPLPLGNSDNVHVGDPVVAIGAPFDLAGTVTSGIISARERPITAGGERGDGSDVSYVDALQTDAPINPGNSGGPLLDADGQVIGINSAIRSAGGADPDGGQAGSIGLGFAIPINQGKRVAEELINTGKATHPVIGITLDMDYSGDGARVAARGGDGGSPVVADGPGDRAGIRAGDVITAIDGRRVHSGEELIIKTRAHRPGDRLELTLVRDEKERTVSLVLGSSDGG